MRTVKIGDVKLGGGKVAVIVPIQPRTLDEIAGLVSAASGADVIEWRVDALDDVGLAQVLEAARLVRGASERPVLATFRTSAEGGPKEISSHDYTELLSALTQSGNVDAIDVEWFAGADAPALVGVAQEAGVAVVGSSHDFGATPPADELVGRMRAMAKDGADVAKVAVMPASNADVLELLGAADRASTELDCPIIAIAMGQRGVVSRVAGGMFGSAATFASVGEESAPGQLALGTVREFLAHRFT